MRIFISYSNSDLALVNMISDSIKSYATPVFWNQNKVPGDSDWESIFSWIQECTIVLVIISESTLKRGLSVGQEVGYARKSDKIVMPFVSRSISISDLGYLKGLTAIHFDNSDPAVALKELDTAIQKQKEKFEASQLTILLSIGAIILFLLSKNDK